jgi:hypothetical protein
VIDYSFINAFTDTFDCLGIQCGGFVTLDCKNYFALLVAEKAVEDSVNQLNQAV